MVPHLHFRWSCSWLYWLGDPNYDAKHHRRWCLLAGGIFLILYYCSQTLLRGVWCRTLVFWAPPKCSVPGGTPFQPGEEQGSPAQPRGLGQTTASHLVSSAAEWLLSPTTSALPSIGNFTSCISHSTCSPVTLHSSKCSMLFPKSPFMVKGISNASSLLLLPLTRRWESYMCWQPIGWRVLDSILPHAGFWVSSRHWKTLVCFAMQASILLPLPDTASKRTNSCWGKDLSVSLTPWTLWPK